MVFWLSVIHPVLALGAIHLAAAAPGVPVRLDGRNTNTTTTNGGAGKCIEKVVQIQASAINTMLKYDLPANQSMVTETIVEFLQVNATLPSQVMGPKRNISGTFSISTKLCWPDSFPSPSNSSIQFLTHGVGFDKSYWDFYSASYSYQDAAAKAGYATLSYDRLGTGSSAHPDPIQVVQAPTEIEIAHQIIQQLRNTKTFGNTQFEKVIGVGHSLGSELTNAITAQHPQDLDAAVLTGFSVDSAGQADFFSGLDLIIARESQPFRFSNLTNGYLIPDSIVSNQFGFFRAPNFDPLVLAATEATKQTFTIGELFTNSMFMGKAGNFTGPIDVADGENDLPFCRSNCLVPQNKAAAVKGALYPNAKNSSTSFVAKGAGHGLNLHYVAGDAYRQIFNFLKENVF